MLKYQLKEKKKNCSFWQKYHVFHENGTDLSLEDKHCSRVTTISAFPQKTRLELTFTKHCTSFVAHFINLPRCSAKSGSHPRSPAAAPVGINGNVERWEEAWVQVSAEMGLPYMGSAANQRDEAFASYSAPASCSLCWRDSRRSARAETNVRFEITETSNSAGATQPGAASNTAAAHSHLRAWC